MPSLRTTRDDYPPALIASSKAEVSILPIEEVAFVEPDLLVAMCSNEHHRAGDPLGVTYAVRAGIVP